MEVDVLSPRNAFRSSVNYESRKRARSPSSPSPVERSSKRQVASPPDCRGTDTSHFMPVAMLRMRRGEDEWVDQTRELTIESPLLGNDAPNDTHFQPSDEMEVSMREDIQMASQASLEALDPRMDVRQDPLPATQGFLREDTLNTSPFTPQYASPLILATELPFADTTMLQSEISQKTPQPPPHVGDQTIVDSTSMIDEDEFEYPPPSATDTSYSEFPPPTRRITNGGQVVPKRVTMGYRANCEKCRQKVPGHWMHLVGDDDDWINSLGS
ncbi:hypothetical protein SCHPADRAFT_993234 [Schizopora paradoxa]|uniref:Uncharacterized protein n=1 Tax=Schizopora paradoxa TaxID=27342 RepID=A0A0H2SNV5_9AGAM|nr:hypothetical protein SCHPADRAFT_993234 [Schizopora paradoxa]